MINPRRPGKRALASYTPYGAPNRSAVQELNKVIFSVTERMLLSNGSPENSRLMARSSALPIED